MTATPKWLIDGYNVMFQSSAVGRGRGPNWLRLGRERLLRLIAQHLPEDELTKTIVVFDASEKSSPDTEAIDALQNSGMRVQFAVEHPEADDLLEDLIRSHPHPKSLRVVSSDHRIQRCAKARKSLCLSTDQFLDYLERADRRQADEFSSRPQPPMNKESRQDNPMDAKEVDYWMREFEIDEQG